MSAAVRGGRAGSQAAERRRFLEALRRLCPVCGHTISVWEADAACLEGNANIMKLSHGWNSLLMAHSCTLPATLPAPFLPPPFAAPAAPCAAVPAAVEKKTAAAAAVPAAPPVPEEDSLTKAFASLPSTATTTATTKASAAASAPSASTAAAAAPPLCLGTPSAIYSCIPPGFSPTAAPDLKACVNLCSAPAPTLLASDSSSDSDSPSSSSLCLNCVDPATACRKAHAEFGSGAFTFALASKQSSPCAVPAPRAKPGDGIEKCAPNQGANNVGCGNKGDNNRG